MRLSGVLVAASWFALVLWCAWLEFGSSVGGSDFPWYALPLIALATNGVILGLVARVPARPHLIQGLYDTEQLLRLPPERRAPVMARVQAFLGAVVAESNLMYGVAQHTLMLSLADQDPSPVVYTAAVALMSGSLLFALTLPRIRPELARQVAAHEGAS